MLGEKIKQLRKAKGKTQAEVAKSLGISRAAYSHIENERNQPDNKVLAKIANYYEVSTDELLGHTVPSWATIKDVMDLEEVLKANDFSYEGETLTKEDREQLLRVIEAIFWERRETKKGE